MIESRNLTNDRERNRTKTLVIYDSNNGNTAAIAESIGAALGSHTKVVNAKAATGLEPKSVDRIIVGSPTLGGRPTESLQKLLDAALKEIKGAMVAAFDTRIEVKFARIFGYAAGKIADALQQNGRRLIAAPEGFVVKGRKGPLADGELERAAAWAKGSANR
jgi:flavodoxin I